MSRNVLQQPTQTFLARLSQPEGVRGLYQSRLIVCPFLLDHYNIILTCVRWYVAYPLSYRQVEELMQERGVSVGHAIINGSSSGRAARMVFTCRCRPPSQTYSLPETAST
jgi:hypothetical protein